VRGLRLLAILACAPLAACACRRPAAEPPPREAVAPSGPAASAPAGALRVDAGARTRVPLEYLVTVAEGAGEAAVREVYGRFGVERLERLAGHVFLVAFSEDPGLDRLEEARRQDARIRAVQPNLVYRGR
jgi:hypothetical protein